VRITAPAEADLDEIAAWIANENPDRAASFVEELWERCRSLGIGPGAFPLRRQSVASRSGRWAIEDI
jgi:plasmid stabilization system protein ParE